jgi:hypothetical protein
MSVPPLNPLLDKEGKASEASRGGLDKKDIVFEDG